MYTCVYGRPYFLWSLVIDKCFETTTFSQKSALTYCNACITPPSPSALGLSFSLFCFCFHPSFLFPSTCYLELDSHRKHMLFVNYWDSVVGTMPLTDSGVLMPGEIVVYWRSVIQRSFLLEDFFRRAELVFVGFFAFFCLFCFVNNITKSKYFILVGLFFLKAGTLPESRKSGMPLRSSCRKCNGIRHIGFIRGKQPAQPRTEAPRVG